MATSEGVEDAAGGQSVEKLRERLEEIRSLVEDHEYDAAYEVAQAYQRETDCSLCEQIATSLGGGIVFTGFTLPDSPRQPLRHEVLVEEIDYYLGLLRDDAE